MDLFQSKYYLYKSKKIDKYKSLMQFILFFVLIIFPNIKSYSLESNDIKNQNLQEENLENEEKTALPKVIEKIEMDYDNPPDTLNEMLEPLPKVGYFYEPIIKNIDITFDCSSIFQYSANKFAYKDEVINPEIGLGVLWKKGIYSIINLGYGSIETKTFPVDNHSINYKIYGPFWHLGLGYKIEYRRGNLIGIVFKYGGSYYSGETIKTKKQGMHAHWAKVVFDAKSKIFPFFNIFFGVELGLKFLFNHTKFDDRPKSYMIPNYGMNTNKCGLTYGLYLQYSFPLYKTFISVE